MTTTLILGFCFSVVILLADVILLLFECHQLKKRERAGR